MKLLGFSFSKISAERFAPNTQGMKINTKLDIKDIKEAKQDMFKPKGDLASVAFSYEIEYTEQIASVLIEGNLIIALDTKLFKEVMKMWKDKQTPEDFKIALLNVIIKKSSVKALALEEEMGLPPHIQFPTLRKQEG